ncbi:MAG: alanine racemase [Planctomycetota bacterium]
MDDTSVVEIDLSAIDHNMGVLRQLVGPSTGICPVLKSNAYGLGAARIARRVTMDGSSMIAVYSPHEANELIAAGISGTFLILMPVQSVGRTDPLYRALITGRVHLSVQDAAHVEALATLADHHAVAIDLHLEIDTGISRCGCPEPDAPAVLQRIDQHPRLRLAGIYTHFSCATGNPERTHAQMSRFESILDECDAWIPDNCLIHTANTAATLRDRRFHRSMIRVGAAWAGYGSDGLIDRDGQRLVDLRPCVTWSSSLVQVKSIPAGAGVGYGQTWTAPQSTVLGVIPVGYADGYPTAVARRDDQPDRPACVGVQLSNTRIEYAPVIGAVSMDMMTIDLTGIVARHGSSAVRTGTTVRLIEPDVTAPSHLPTLASSAGLLPYQLLCGLDANLKRIYRESASTPVIEIMPRSLIAS